MNHTSRITEFSNSNPRTYEEVISNLKNLNGPDFRTSLEQARLYLERILEGITQPESLKPYFDREQILAFCKRLPNARDRAVLLSVFEGIYGKLSSEIIQIRPEDVLDHGIYLQGRNTVFPASKELIEFYRESFRAGSFQLISRNGTGKTVPLYENGSAIKTLSENGEINGRMIAIRFARIFEFLGLERIPTISDIRDCGQIYYYQKDTTDDFVKRFNFSSFYKNNLLLKMKERGMNAILEG